MFSRGAVESVAKHADDVRFEELADCGHFPPQERPDLVAEQLRAFFAAAALGRGQPSRRGRVPSMRARRSFAPSTPRPESLTRRIPVALVTAEPAAQTKFPRL